jgi:simple sugar transport system ATP-binding protein
LLEERSKGGAVLLVSEDLEELLSLSDRVAVMYEGEIVGVMDQKDADINTIGLMMTGSLRGDPGCPPVETDAQVSNNQGAE